MNTTILCSEMPDLAPPELCALLTQPTATVQKAQSNRPKKRRNPVGSVATKRPKKAKANRRRASSSAAVAPVMLAEQPSTSQIGTAQALATVTQQEVQNDSFTITMSDVLNTVRDSFDNVIAPSICGIEKTLANKILVRMYQHMTLSHVAKQVDENHGGKTIACEDLAKYMVESLQRLNVNVFV